MAEETFEAKTVGSQRDSRDGESNTPSDACRASGPRQGLCAPTSNHCPGIGFSQFFAAVAVSTPSEARPLFSGYCESARRSYTNSDANCEDFKQDFFSRRPYAGTHIPHGAAHATVASALGLHSRSADAFHRTAETCEFLFKIEYARLS